jgi:hypothetical protein
MTASVPIVPPPTPIDAPATHMCHARYLVSRAIKAQMQAAGYKVSHIEARIINVKADDFLRDHRDALLAEAVETIARVPGLRKIAEQEAKARRQTVR